jgi:hypothetical protein
MIALLFSLLTIVVINLGCEDDDTRLDTSAGDLAPIAEDRYTESQDSMGDQQRELMDAGQPEASDGASSISDDARPNDSTDSDVEPMTDASPLPDYNGPRKKGIAIHQGTYDWSQKIAAVKPFWSYSWGLKKSRFQPDGIEFVPMKWSGSLSDDQADYLREQFAAGEIHYLLGYNEPDGERQANMGVDRALELWSELEDTGIPLVSPSPVHYDNEWMVEFMRRADDQGLRVDDLAVHWYGGTNAQGFLDLLDRVYERYQRPIWITEFAPADWEAERREENRMRPDAVLEFMRQVLPELDRRDYIVRYAWFHDYSSDNLWTSALFNDEGELTPLGEFYAQHTANPAAGLGKPYPGPTPDPSNLLKNGGFELGDSGDWGGYERGFPSIDSTETYEGAFCAWLRGGFSSTLSQKVDLEAGSTYRVTLHTRWAQAPGQPVSAALERASGVDVVRSPPFEDTQWQESSFTYTPTETAEHTFWLWTGENISSDLYVDSVSISLEE